LSPASSYRFGGPKAGDRFNDNAFGHQVELFGAQHDRLRDGWGVLIGCRGTAKEGPAEHRISRIAQRLHHGGQLGHDRGRFGCRLRAKFGLCHR
jgi:hypothetical protein